MMIPHSSSLLESESESSNNGSVTKIENELNGWHVKPEFVFYPGSKGSPKGYYVGLYGKVDKYGITIPTETETNSFDVTGSFMRIGGGMIMGYQWLIKDKVSIDWWFLGLGLDSYTLSFESSSKNSEVITEEDKEEIKNSVTFMGKSPTVETSNNNKDVKVDFPSFLFPCFRFGLSVGYAF